ncbi:hypothetical protein N0V83_006217 [Neocucurbitaria cava]|uniref:Uncharacterized protein n=1 Tax=Neocucurbitaria cava TaxID=798079 RepID=A0A9W9CLF2_9PLEO|nr:hypothetical protein N0V83_006217 [Neocucurbitaria cava]
MAGYRRVSGISMCGPPMLYPLDLQALFDSTSIEDFLGYDLDHKDIDLLRLRNFTIGRRLLDYEVVGPKGLDRVAELILDMVPFITYLNSVCMPDEDTSSSSEDESDAGSDDDNDSADADGDAA